MKEGAIVPTDGTGGVFSHYQSSLGVAPERQYNSTHDASLALSLKMSYEMAKKRAAPYSSPRP